MTSFEKFLPGFIYTLYKEMALRQSLREIG
jgi:hypothetical protein